MPRVFAAAVIGVLLSAATFAQTPAAPATAPGAPAPTTSPAQAPAVSDVAEQGDPDPGVHFVVVVDNPQVRVLQVTLLPGAVRRPHAHNDVTFSMMVPVTGSIELTVEQQAPIATVLGQAYYLQKGQAHSFANRTAAPVQVIDLFVKPPTP